MPSQVTYVIKTSTGIPLAEGTKNACEAMEEAGKDARAVMMMDLFQLPKSCPVEAVRAALCSVLTLLGLWL